MLLRLSIVCSAFALLHTQALADSQYLGTIAMYVCDGGEDLCSNTLTSAPINLTPGPFTEDFVFDFVNNFPHYPDDVPGLQAKALLATDNSADLNSGKLQLYDSSGKPFGFEIMPFIFNGSGYSARSGDLIYPGVGYYAEVTGVSSADALPLQVSISAFDLGPIIAPEPSTWAMMLLGAAGLGFMARRRRRSALVLRDGRHNPSVPHRLPRLPG
jgi:PEP-CTERM motif